MASSLLNGLVAGWKMEEATGATRLDVLGISNLTSINNVLQDTSGKIGNGASNTQAANNWLSTPNNSNLQFSGGFTIIFWYKPRTGDVSPFAIVAKDDANIARSFASFNNAWAVFQTDNTGPTVNFTAPTTDVWNMHCFMFDNTDNKAKVSMNNGTLAAGTALTLPYNNTTQPYTVGKSPVGGGFVSSGSYDEMYIWNRVLTTGEISALYNQGIGMTYPFTDERLQSSTLVRAYCSSQDFSNVPTSLSSVMPLASIHTHDNRPGHEINIVMDSSNDQIATIRNT